MNIKQFACVLFAVMLCVSQVACSQSQILNDLDYASVALAAVANVPGLSPTVTSALSDSASALDCIAAAVQAGGTNAQVAVASAGCALKAFKPDIPAGTPQTVVNLIQALDDAIAKVMSDQAQIAVAMNEAQSSPHATAFAAKGPQGSKTFDPGRGGKTKVTKVRKALADAKAKLKKPSPVTTVKQCPPNCN